MGVTKLLAAGEGVSVDAALVLADAAVGVAGWAADRLALGLAGARTWGRELINQGYLGSSGN